MTMKGLIDFFLVEAEEHISSLEKGFLTLEKHPSDDELLQELFRSAHTLKGSAALVKLTVISEISHAMEDVLEEIRDGKRSVSKDVIDWLLHTVDGIKHLISEVVAGREEKRTILHEIVETLEVISDQEGLKKEVEEIPSLDKEVDAVVEKRRLGRRKEDLETISSYVRVHMDNIEKMMSSIGELTILKNYLTSETDEVFNLRDEIEYAGRRLLREIDEFGDRYSYSIPEKVTYVDSLLEEFRELEFDRYDELNLFARKLQEITSDITEALKGITGLFDKFTGHIYKLGRLSTDLRDLVSAARMVETGRLFQRFTRVVRDLSEQNGKKVRYIVSGVDTRIDRILYERLFEPLLHIMRNCISHGIELPEERLEAGKPEEGRVALSARREGNTVVIDVKDDGRGVNLKSVYLEALKRGAIGKDEKVTRARLLSVLFTSGFSTYGETDLVSGRGVGLDVVRQAIAEMNGTIDVATVEGKGTIFRIRLPLSLIIVNIIRFRAGNLQFSVPSTLVQELVEVNQDHLRDEGGYITIRDREYEVKDLAGIFELRPDRSTGTVPAIVFSVLPGKEVVLLVDEIVGQEDTVIKPLGRFLEGLKCYAGVSISADGRLTPVLNPTGLFDEKFEVQRGLPEDVSGRAFKNILVVDDSLSVRKFVSILLEQNGYRALTASNGLEALHIIDEEPVDLIITDLEMPVMHGYELLGELKRRGMINSVPTIVLTSRSSEKHREKASLLGAKDFIIKPFEEPQLLRVIRNNISSLHLT
ncbi:chemotaxis protein CheA [bacterium BMS3Bbin06]|nr:chemotaxis protein CheA [bacterium BMS3Bbin06]HDO36562.1 hybrid sensor histidine kinase/response regulator [Nitrospirota bacterium]HDY72008.1 hybrid sensor histidine kinase/response regulator [Nitrospirota bacterium]